MPIEKLPNSTALRLKSTVLLLTPDAVVKELVDNALDAEASSIEVQISANTIDKIQVRDNGTGINPQDYASLARPSHTSKLRSFDELQLKAGQTLGFRGDALASATDIAQTTIVTRTAADAVAMKLEFLPNARGEQSPRPVSAPVGTTVTLLCPFDGMPVRKKEYTKKAPHFISSIKRQLLAYALARPHVKITFKFLGETSKSDWSYAPARPPSARDAATQGLGLEVVSNCISKTFVGLSTATPEPSNTVEPPAAPQFKALMPKPGAHGKAISGHGAFISIDSRPVTALRGTMKKIADMFKAHLRRHLGSKEQVTKPFLQLDIATTPGSYDVNTTSAKDEVMFVREQELLRLFEEMCLEVYPLVSTLTEPPSSTSEVDVPDGTLLEPDISDPILNEPTTIRKRGVRGETPGFFVPSNLQELATLQDMDTERDRLQDALNHTLPGMGGGQLPNTPFQFSDHRDEDGSTSPAVLTQARLVGSKIDLMRTKTTSTVDESTPSLSVLPWSDDLDGPGDASGTIREKSNPWVIAKSAARDPKATVVPRATSPPPTPQAFDAGTQNQISPVSSDSLPGIHKQAGSVMLTPTYGCSPAISRNPKTRGAAKVQYQSTDMAGISRPILQGRLQAKLQDVPLCLNFLSELSNMDEPEVDSGRDLFLVGRQQASPVQVPDPTSVVDNCRNLSSIEAYLVQDPEHRRQTLGFQEQSWLENTDRMEEGAPWISHQASSPGVLTQMRKQQQGERNTIGSRPIASPMTLHQYLGGTTGGIEDSPRPVNACIGQPEEATASGEPHQHHHLTATTSLGRSTQAVWEELGSREPMINMDSPPDEGHRVSRETSTACSPPRMPLKARRTRSRLNSRQRSTSQVGSKTPKRLRSSGLPLERIEKPTAGTQLVIKHVDMKSLALNMDLMATYDAYILTGALDYTLRGRKQLDGPVGRCVQTVATNWLRDMVATADRPETRPR
jgi:DNA mismatch repair protein MutL